MALPATDAFAGTGALSGSWTHLVTGLERLSDKVTNVGGGGPSMAVWTADAFYPGHYAQAVVTEDASAGGGVIVQASGSGASAVGYWVYSTTATSILYKITAGPSLTNIQTLPDLYATGDVMKMTIEGNVIKVYKNAVQNGIDEDETGNSPLTGGRPGMGLYTASAAFRLDDFEADNVGSPPASSMSLIGGLVSGGLVGGRLIA